VPSSLTANITANSPDRGGHMLMMLEFK